ncbi:MAG TPA: hypothetical protein VGP07_00730 [Polyangia bacterium]|jgi:hypothetical protein
MREAKRGAGATPLSSSVASSVALALLLGLLVGVPFFAATTFIGDDHLFLAFARYVPNPLVAFVRDQHGGEFYRPLPMLLWWVLGRLAPLTPAVFGAFALALHATAAALTGGLVLAVRGDRRLAVTAALLFFVAPLTREAAYWYAASTDLLATVFGLATLLALLRGRRALAVALFCGACWSKETAIVVPLLAALVLAMRMPEAGWRAPVARAAPLVPVAVAYLLARTLVLHGLGGSGDPAASAGGKLLQLAAGLVHALTGTQIFGALVAWVVGLVAWALLLAGTARATRGGQPRLVVLGPLLLIALTVLPLLAAPWIVGARYFYLPCVGIAWLAAERLRRFGVPVVVGVLCGLAGLGLGQDLARRGEVVAYEARLMAARRGIVSGLAEGFTTFHVDGGIKDLDLAVKEDPRVRPREGELLVLGDVPASFVALPAGSARGPDVDFLLARPPLPPSGAYHFGERRIVGLAREGDDPTLDEVIAHFPRLRFLRLRPGPGGRVIARDVTDSRAGEVDGEE